MIKASRFVQGGFAVLFGLSILSVIARGYVKYPSVGITAILILGTLFTFGMIKLYDYLRRKTIRLSQKKINKIFMLIALGVFILQILSVFALKFEPVSDLSYVNGAAKNFCQSWNKTDLPHDLPLIHINYFARYPNNHALLIVLSLVYSACNHIFGSMPLIVPMILNAIGLNISYIFMYLIAGKIFKDKFTPLFCAIIGAGFSVFYTYTPFFYTDPMSMPFSMGSIYFFLAALDSPKLRTKILQLSASSLLLIAGYKMKGNVIILIPVYILYLIVTCNKERIKNYCKVLCILLAGLIASSAACTAFIDSFDIASQAEAEVAQFPPEHWIMMGLHDRGGFYLDDFWLTNSHPTYETKKEANIAEIKKRISDYGFTGLVKHFAKKISWTWGDGTYFIGYYMKRSIENSKTDMNIFRYIVSKSGAFKIYCSVYQFLLLFMILFSFIDGAVSKKQGCELILKIIICGVYFFFAIWETRSRYLVNFTPVFIITAVYSVKTLSAIIKRSSLSYGRINLDRKLKKAG